MRYKKITQHKIIRLVTNSKFAISQYGQIRPCDKVMCIIKSHQVKTLHTAHANFNYDISTMDLKKGHITRTHNTRAPFTQYFTAWSTFETPLKIKDK
jgi:hypothetical protein